MTKDEVTKMLMMFRAAFQNMQIHEGTTDVYHAALCNMPVEFVRLAVRRLMKEDREFPPPPGVIYSMAEEYRGVERMRVKKALPEPKPTREAAKKILSDLSEKLRKREIERQGILLEVSDDFDTEN